MNIDKIKQNVVVTSSDCWEWQNSCNSAGYGQLTENKVYWLAHRYAYSCGDSLLKTDVVRHLCHNTKCCNPAHLVKGTHKDNWNDSREVHQAASVKQRKDWIIQGVVYTSARQALKATGLSTSTLSKFTDFETREFDVEAYRKGCKRAAWEPKI